MAAAAAAEPESQGHAKDYAVRALTLLPDSRVASAGEDGQIFLWTTADERCTRLTGRAPPARASKAFIRRYHMLVSMVTLTDGRIAAGHDDGSLFVYSPDTSYLNHFRVGGEGTPYALAALPGNRLACAVHDTNVEIWDAARGKLLTILVDAHPQSVDLLATLSDGRLAIGSSCSDYVHIWDIASRTCVKTLSVESPDSEEEESEISALCALPDGRLATCHDNGTIRLWNVSTGECVQTITDHCIMYADSLIYLPSGHLASASDESMTIAVHSLETGMRVKVYDEEADDDDDKDEDYDNVKHVNALCALPCGGIVAGYSDGSCGFFPGIGATASKDSSG